MNRSKSFDESLSQLMRKHPKKAKHFILGLIEGEDGWEIEDALKETIYRMGVKEFSEWAGQYPTHVTAFLKGRRKLKPETLNEYLEPFGLRTKLTLEEVA